MVCRIETLKIVNDIERKFFSVLFLSKCSYLGDHILVKLRSRIVEDHVMILDVALCSLVETEGRFTYGYRLHHQDELNISNNFETSY